ncbi:ABC transporter ATP-binding protein [Nocardioides lianchengensis]|uniref:Putative ABC transport system ATP-binding protein n=1 Tax=Nocardioides lianchengensis TaxID=1045774 RepID=A0A1G6VPA0_9ACTN|nr:ABC transporter ATP-binding protein [Nocardioides lianchengensis]NYG11251.1 putative ABC transport system ATP-binding protein [Nocardioides lianchengensis]SDD55480.1 putative ABC transport system ATP-binding protein [Nocardioides lianchengensis]
MTIQHSAPRPAVRTEAAVHLEDLHKSYAGGAEPVHAVRGVSLTLGTGSFTAVMGPSGSGKSTLLACAAGLDVPSRGRVVVGGQDISAFSPDALTRFRREHVGFVFQAYNLIDHLSVVENVTLPLVLAGRRPDAAHLDRLLGSVGLNGMEQRRPHELSGGQAQRVAIARALVTSPDVVLADEPTGALDSATAAQVLQVLRTTARELGQTVVLVTHDPQVAASADRVLFLADGRLVGQLDDPTVEQVTARMIGLGR